MFVSRGRVLATLLAPSLVVGALVVGACSSESGGDQGEALTAETILADSAAAMAEVQTAAFVLEQEGAPRSPIDEAGQLLFRAADGRVAQAGVRPRPSITVDALGFTTEVGAIAIDGHRLVHQPPDRRVDRGSGQLHLRPGRALFDPEDGFAGLLAEVAAIGRAPVAEATDAYRGRRSATDGGPWHRVVRGHRLVGPGRQSLTGGLVSEGRDDGRRLDRPPTP